MADEALPGLLNRRLEARAQRVVVGVVMAPHAAVLDVDRLRQVGGQGDEAVVGDDVDPLDDFRNPTPRAGHLAGLAEQPDADFLLFVGLRVLNGDGLRLHRQVAHLQAVVEEGVAFDVDARRRVVAHRIADLHQAVGEPVAQAVALQHRHHHVDVGLELDQALTRVAYGAVADALELDAVVLLKRSRRGRRSIRYSSSWRRDGWRS